jgi:glycine/D-amino acid oxidase-like deaminating enzyme
MLKDRAAPPHGVFWLEEAMADEVGASCPPLTGARHCDVCIVGGGYTGLWSAIEIKRLSPDTSVTVLEATGCGFGASGRNGGWATSWFDELDRLVERFGPEEGLRLADRSSESVANIRDTAEEHGFDCDFRQEGSLWVATSEAQEEAISGVASAICDHGRADLVREVDADECLSITGSHAARRGLLLRDSAAVQPAKLARGLRKAALDLGVDIHEGSPMIDLERGDPALVRTMSGSVEADRVILANNAWMARIRELRRAVFIVGTQIVLTEPVPGYVASRRWRKGMLFGDARMFVHYAQVTRDGRIAFGRGGGAISAAGKVIPKHFVDPATAGTVVESFRSWFPDLAKVRLTHSWGGAVDRAPGHLPFVGSIGDSGNINYGIGYSGNGVAPSNLLGQVLARRTLDVVDDLHDCALATGPPGYLPPEPLRFAGAALVRNMIQRSEDRESRGHMPGPVGRLARRLANFSLPARTKGA